MIFACFLSPEFGELVFRRGLPAGSGVVLFRIPPDSPDSAGDPAANVKVSTRGGEESGKLGRIRLARCPSGRNPHR